MTTYKGFSTYNRYKKFRLTDFEIAKQDLFNHFHISKGEKLMNPKFGTIIWNCLFEPFTPQVQQAIVDDIKTIVKYDPRLLVGDVNVSEYEYGIQIDIQLTYVPTNQTELLKLRFDQNNKTALVL
jgi:phage baseplate assembly protein W